MKTWDLIRATQIIKLRVLTNPFSIRTRMTDSVVGHTRTLSVASSEKKIVKWDRRTWKASFHQSDRILQMSSVPVTFRLEMFWM